MVPPCMGIVQVLFRPPTSMFLEFSMYLTYPIICALWDNELNQIIILFFTILGVLCRIRGQHNSLGPALELGVCFLWKIFIFHLLLLFLLLLQLLQFLPYHVSHFSILVFVMHYLLGYNSQLLRVCWVLCPKTILIVLYVSQENNQLCLLIIVNPFLIVFLS